MLETTVSTSNRSDASAIVNLPVNLKAQRLALIFLCFRIWTGRAAMHQDDYEIGDDGELPSSKVAASYGQKRIIDPAHLKIFTQLKRRADVVLADAGLPFCRGTVVPIDKAAEIADQLQEIAIQFNQERDALVSNFPSLRAEWINKNPKFAEQLNAIPCPMDLNTRVNADFSIVSFQSVGPAIDKTASVERNVEGLFSEVLKDVAYRSERLYRRSVLGKTENDLTLRTLSQLKTMREKLTGLQFLNSGVRPLIEVIERLLQAMPNTKNRKFSTDQFNTLCAGLSLLSNVSLLKEVADGKLNLDEFLKNSFGVKLPPLVFSSQPSSSNQVVVESVGEETLDDEVLADQQESEAQNISPQETATSSIEETVCGIEPASVTAPSEFTAIQPLSEETENLLSNEELPKEISVSSESDPSDPDDLEKLLQACFSETEDEDSFSDTVTDPSIPPAPDSIMLSIF